MNSPVLAHGEQRLSPSILYLDGVTVSFDGFRALNNLSLLMEPGELRAIIGPNGAGKTTMMDVITGKVKPDTGDVLFDNQAVDLTTHDESDIAQMGIGRKFQKPTVFEQQTVYHNLLLALKANRGVWFSLRFQSSREQKKLVGQVLEQIRLTDQRYQSAGTLSHGQKQWLEIGMLLVQDARLLLVDEPAAGMTDAETEKTAILLKEISGEKSVMVVEHDMEFVKALDCPVTVLHEGSVLAEGTHAEVQANAEVIEVYLGR